MAIKKRWLQILKPQYLNLKPKENGLLQAILSVLVTTITLNQWKRKALTGSTTIEFQLFVEKILLMSRKNNLLCEYIFAIIFKIEGIFFFVIS